MRERRAAGRAGLLVRFFHGYYDCHCYLPLYVFCGRHLLAAKLAGDPGERWAIRWR